MGSRTNSQTSELFKQYLYHRFCDEYDADGASKSLDMLYKLSGLPSAEKTGMPREDQFERLKPHLPSSLRPQIALAEETMERIYQIDADCEDVPVMEKTITNLREISSWLKTSQIRDIKTLTSIHNHIYNQYQQLYPSNKEYLFAELKKMVGDIKTNDGTFDHEPLNTAAKRMFYFMRDIPIEKRYPLLIEINRKTFDKSAYDYRSQLENFKEQYDIALRKKNWEEKQLKREANQERYKLIRSKELPDASDNRTKIELYNELLTLINDQDFGRTRKFQEKKTIYNHLIRLYQEEGMTASKRDAEASREKFINAANIAKEAARIRGYQQRS